MNYLYEWYIFNKNNEAIEQIKSHKKRSPEMTRTMNKCKAENQTLLSRTKFEHIDREEVEKAFEKLRERRKVLEQKASNGNTSTNNS